MSDLSARIAAAIGERRADLEKEDALADHWQQRGDLVLTAVVRAAIVERRRMLDAFERIVAEHAQSPFSDICSGCDFVEYPCSTLRAVAAGLGLNPEPQP